MKTDLNNEKKTFIEREWKEDIEGKYDEDGFFITPNGSFWDADYVYFNRQGFDRHGGSYNDNGDYVPGKGWDDNMNCYESEKEQIVCEENELDEDLKEEFMRKKLDKFDDRKNLFKGKDLVKNDPNIEIEIIYQKKKNKTKVIKNKEKKVIKVNKNKKNNINKPKITNIKRQNKNKIFFIKTEDGDKFKMNRYNNKIYMTKNKCNNGNYKIINKFEEYTNNGIKLEISQIQESKPKNNYWKNKKNIYDYRKYSKKSKKYDYNKKEYKTYNIFEDEEKKYH